MLHVLLLSTELRAEVNRQTDFSRAQACEVLRLTALGLELGAPPEINPNAVRNNTSLP